MYALMKIRTGKSKVLTRVEYDDATCRAIESVVISTVSVDSDDYEVDVTPTEVNLPKRKITVEQLGEELQETLTIGGECPASLAELFGECNREILPKKANMYAERDNEVMCQLAEVSANMFNKVNPLTGEVDVKADDFFAPFVTLAVYGGAMGVQKDEQGNEYFNPNGTVSVAEFLESLYTFKSGESVTAISYKSEDNISDATDFFNNGYNSCLDSAGSPFYRLYDRKSLRRPITRAELAYITVVCWNGFRRKYGSVLTSNRYGLGCNVNWNAPQNYVRKYEDTASQKYRVYKKCANTLDGVKVLSIDLKAYSPNITELVMQMKQGVKGIPLPMFMSLIELDALNLFPFGGSVKNLYPLKEVSREELSYFLVQMARTFPEVA